MPKAYLLAHDLGTTGNKATLFDEAGTLVASAFESYPTFYDQPGWVEQDPESWWAAVCRASSAVLQKAGVGKTAVAGMSFSGHMMGCVPVDQNGRALRRAIIWADQRAGDQTRQLLGKLSQRAVYEITGTRPNPNYTLEKLMWLRDREPDVYAKTRAVLQSKDYVVARLTGETVTDPSDASATNAYDLQKKDWSDEILAAADIPRRLFPRTVPSTQVVGKVRQADGVDLSGVPVVIGGGDGSCATVGAGVISAGEGYNYFGSSSWIAIATDRPVIDPEMRIFNLCHLVPDLYMPVGTMQSAGGSYDWIREILFPPGSGTSADDSYARLNAWAAASPAGSHGVLFLPYLIGERSPHWNENARGAFVGLARSHGVEDMVRAVLEGVAFNLLLIFRALTEQGAPLRSLRMIGGGIRNPVLRRVLAGVLGLPIRCLESGEFATSLGAAVCAGVGTGVFDDFRIVDQLCPVALTEEPHPDDVSAYRKLGPAFEQAYRALEPVFDELAPLQAALR
ncbi:MAG: xylulokinase [Candidatus Bipolaricaulota bacterium]